MPVNMTVHCEYCVPVPALGFVVLPRSSFVIRKAVKSCRVSEQVCAAHAREPCFSVFFVLRFCSHSSCFRLSLPPHYRRADINT